MEEAALKVVDANLVAYIHPSNSTSIREAVLYQLSTLLFKFNETFGGVVLAYDPDVRSKLGKLLLGVHPYFGVPFKAKLLLFNPLQDMILEGEVIKVSKRSIHVIVFGFASGTIAEEDIREEFKYKNKYDQEFFVNRAHKKHRIKAGTFLRFSVKSFDEEILHICGSLGPVQTGCVRWLERHLEEWSHFESTSKKRTTTGEIEVATPRKGIEEILKHEKVVVDMENITVTDSRDKKPKRRKSGAK